MVISPDCCVQLIVYIIDCIVLYTENVHRGKYQITAKDKMFLKIVGKVRISK